MLCLVSRSVVAQGTAFTYQGVLNDTNGPVNGSYDLQFLLFDAAEGGSQQGLTLDRFGMVVSNGLFTTTLDYGANIFTGPSRWLEIRVAPFETRAFTTLAPRQPLTPTPYALYAPNAGTAASATSVPWLALTGVPAGLADGVDDNTLYSAGSGLSLAGTIFSLNTAFTDARYDARYWKLTGNAGTTPGVNYLGTSDNQALEFKVNSGRAFRLEPTTNAPNVIGGHSDNAVTPGAYGAVIAGGANNSASGRFATIGGGNNNTAGGAGAFIGGGLENVIEAAATSALIGGGYGNEIEAGACNATVAGGELQSIGTNSIRASIGGGWMNRIAGTTAGLINASTIAGGYDNTIEHGSSYSTVGGGASNFIGTNVNGGTISGGIGNHLYADRANIGGGWDNTLATNSTYAVISGGTANDIQKDATSTTIGGGTNNVIHAGASRSTIGGGVANSIGTNATSATVAGGGYNHIRTGGQQSTIGGGNGNTISTNAEYAVIAGGRLHFIGVSATGATIGGGSGNAIGTNATYTTIAGGIGHTIGPRSIGASIGGGDNNEVGTNALRATVSGGYQNIIRSDSGYATIGGGGANWIETNSTYSTVSGGYAHTIEPNTSYATIAGGYANLISSNADYAMIPGGRFAKASHYAQLAHASGRFAVTGDAQASAYVVRRTTTDATQSELFLDGASLRLTVPSGATWTFEVLVVGRSNTGNSAGYRLTGVVENVGGAMAGTFQAPEVLREDVAAWEVDATTDNVNDALVIRVTGSAGQTVRWVATVRTAEVIF